MVPALALPALVTMTYTSSKLANNTVYKSYKDSALIARKFGNNIKIFQDIIRPDLLKEIKNLNETEKAGFLQLQSIIGLSKFDDLDKHGKKITFETDSHGILRKTLISLEKLGYIQNYTENFKKNTNLILPKLAFGNIKGLKNKVDLYNIKFQMTDKKIDIDDPKLQKTFPLVFSNRQGLLCNHNYNVIHQPDGSLAVDYHANQSYIPKKI